MMLDEPATTWQTLARHAPPPNFKPGVTSARTLCTSHADFDAYCVRYQEHVSAAMAVPKRSSADTTALRPTPASAISATDWAPQLAQQCPMIRKS